MGGVWIVTKREFRSYFLSPIAYVVGAVFLVLGGYMFFQSAFLDVGQQAEARLNRYFGMLPMYFLILVPLISMRLWSEERKLGTLELLLTFPCSTSNLILGKFLGALIFVATLLALTLIYPFTMSMFGPLDWGPVICGYLGALLLAGAYLALGMFISSLTRDQIIAAIATIVVLFLLYYVPQLAAYFLPKSWIEPVTMVSPVTHFMSIARGVLDLGDLIFYSAFIALFLFLNNITLEMRKWVG